VATLFQPDKANLNEADTLSRDISGLVWSRYRERGVFGRNKETGMTKTINYATFVAVMCLLAFGGALECFAQKRDRDSFEEAVKPFLSTHCYGCHSGEDAEAELNLEELAADFSTETTTNRWIDVMQSLQFGEMPPPEAGNCWHRNMAIG